MSVDFNSAKKRYGSTQTNTSTPTSNTTPASTPQATAVPTDMFSDARYRYNGKPLVQVNSGTKATQEQIDVARSAWETDRQAKIAEIDKQIDDIYNGTHKQYSSEKWYNKMLEWAGVKSNYATTKGKELTGKDRNGLDFKDIYTLEQEKTKLQNQKFSEDYDYSGAKLIPASVERGLNKAVDSVSTMIDKFAFVEHPNNYYEPVQKDIAFQGARQQADPVTGLVSDIGYTAANMLPSLAVGAINPIAGITTIGATSGFGAYNEAKGQGKSEDEAIVYGTITGITEAGMQSLLGGINIFGKSAASKIAGKQIKQAISKLSSNKAVQVALKQIASMGSEATEEYLQEILSPVWRNIAFNEKNEFKPFTKEALYSGFLGAIMAGGSNITQFGVEKAAQIAKNGIELPTNYTEAKDFNDTLQTSTEASKTSSDLGEQIPTNDIMPMENTVATNEQGIDDGIVQPTYSNEDFATVDVASPAVPNASDVVAPQPIISKTNTAKLSKLENSVRTTMQSKGEIIPNGNLYSVSTVTDRADIKAARLIAKAANADVVFVKPNSEQADTFNGMYVDGTIYISENADNAANVVLGHELMHDMEKNAPNAYAKFQKVFSAEIDNRAAKLYAQSLANNRQASLGKKTTKADFLSEAAADFAGEMYTNPEILKQIYEQSPSLAKRIVAHIKKVLDQLKQLVNPSYEVQKFIKDGEKVIKAYVTLNKEAQAEIGVKTPAKTVNKSDAKSKVTEAKTEVKETKSETNDVSQETNVKEQQEFTKSFTNLLVDETLIGEYGLDKKNSGKYTVSIRDFIEDSASTDGDALYIARKILDDFTTDSEFYTAYKDLKTYLRNTKIKATREILAETDYNALRRTQMGRIMLTSKVGTPLDTIYGELCEDYPGLFDPDISNSADQLHRIIEVRNMLDNQKTNYLETYGKEVYNDVSDYISKQIISAKEMYNDMGKGDVTNERTSNIKADSGGTESKKAVSRGTKKVPQGEDSESIASEEGKETTSNLGKSAKSHVEILAKDGKSYSEIHSINLIQKELELPDGAVEEAKSGNFLASPSAFAAKAATLKKGQYLGTNILEEWMPEMSSDQGLINLKHKQALPLFNALTNKYPERFLYTNTHGVDTLNVLQKDIKSKKIEEYRIYNGANDEGKFEIVSKEEYDYFNNIKDSIIPFSLKATTTERIKQEKLRTNPNTGKPMGWAGATFAESAKATEEMRKKVNEEYDTGAYDYERANNKTDEARAKIMFREKGCQESVNYLNNKFDNNQRFNSVDTYLYEEAIVWASKNLNDKEFLKLKTDFTLMKTQAGQMTQAGTKSLASSPLGAVTSIDRYKKFVNGENKNLIDRDKVEVEVLAPQIEQGKEKQSQEELITVAEKAFEIHKKKTTKTAEQRLSDKITNKIDSVNDNAPTKNNAITDMVNELFKIAQELNLDLPTKDKPTTKRSKIDFLREAIEQSEKYKETWDKAKEIVSNKYKGDTEITNMLNDYFEKGLPPTYSLETVYKSAEEIASRIGVEFKRVLKKHRTDTKPSLANLWHMSAKEQALTIQRISDLLIDEVGLDTADAIQLSADVLEGYMKGLRENGIIKLEERFSRLHKDIKVPAEVYKDIMSQTTPQGLQDAMDRAIDTLSAQLPSTLNEKSVAFRYLAMLSSPKTHMINMLSTAVMTEGLVRSKDFVGAFIENVLGDRIGIDKQYRTKAFINRKRDSTLFKDAITAFDQSARLLASYAKMGIDQRININKKIFTSNTFRLLEEWRKFNFNLLEKEDFFFMSRAFQRAYVQMAKARGYSSEFLNSGTLEAVQINEEITKYSVDEALKSTFRNVTKLSQAIRSFKGSNKIAKFFIDATIPFTNVPINIAARGIEYSPIGLLHGISDLVFNVKKETNAADRAAVFTKGVDRISAGLTGTGIMMLGMLFSSLGLVVASPDDDDSEKARQFGTDTGKMKYSLKIGNTYYSLDWLSPAAIPFFVGVEMTNIAEISEGDFDDVLFKMIDGAVGMLDPMTEMTVLKGVTSALSSYETGGKKIGAILNNAVQGYLGQYVPTVVGQLNRALFDRTRRSTFSQKGDSPYSSDWGIWAKQQMAKVPGASYLLEPSVDRYGDTQYYPGGAFGNVFLQVLIPGKFSQASVEAIDKELTTIYNDTKETSVLPASPYKNNKVTYGKIDYKFTAKQQTLYNTTLGTNYYDTLKTMTESDYYKGLSSDLKADMLSDAQVYAKAIAKKAVLNNIGITNEIDGWEANAQEAESVGITPSMYIYFKTIINSYQPYKYANGNPIPNGASAEKRKLIDSLGLTSAQKKELYALFEVSKAVQAMSASEVNSAYEEAKNTNGKTKPIAPATSSSTKSSGDKSKENDYFGGLKF